MGSDLLPFLTMVIVQLGYAGMNIISKLAMDSGMNPFVHVAYRQIFATIAIAPFAYFLERKTRPKLTPSILFQIFLCSIFGYAYILLSPDSTYEISPGVSMNQITYFVGLKNTTPTISCALSNLTPAVTFLLAIPFGLERVGVGSKAGQAKMLGTILCVGGAMLLSFYHGPIVPIDQPNIHWKYAQDMTQNKNTNNHANFILGPFLLIVSALSWGIWSILQAKLSLVYSAPYSSSALMCLMASFQCLIVGLCFDHNTSDWSLRHSIRAVSAIYAGVVCTALAYCLMSWCIERKGPLYVSVFSPLLLVIVAILSWGLLQEKIYIGTVVGSVLIVLGLYGVLWGKNNELKPIKFDEEIGDDKDKQKNGMEMQLQQGSIIVNVTLNNVKEKETT